MNVLYLSAAMLVCFDNDNDAYIPDIWANEALMQLEENMVMARLCHTDFKDEIANFGETVNTRRPEDFKIRRKTDSDTLSHQDARSTNVPVVLNQWFYDSFVIKDGERSKSFQELIDIYLTPAGRALARGIDRALLGHVHKFFANRVGKLSTIDSTVSSDYVLDAREKLNINKAPPEGRSLVVSPTAETAMLKNTLFVQADKRGDGGNALENARLGRIYGFDTFMAQNVNDVRSGAEVATGTVTAALAAGGSGSQAVTITGYEAVVGEYATVVGNGQPTHITAKTSGAGDTTAVTMNEANKNATGAGAVITVFKSCDVDGAYAVGYSKEITVDGFASNQPPQVGQLVAFGTGGNRREYTVIESEVVSATSQKITLDRPLEVALADNDLCFPGPYGSMNWAFHRNALALVTRPLALPRTGSGALSGNAMYNNLAMRVTMQYDIDVGGTKVNLDMLAGIALLDANLAAVLLG